MSERYWFWSPANDGHDGRLLSVILDEDRRSAVGAARSVGCALSPVEFDELFGDGSDRELELAAVIGTELHGEVGDGD
jgi:hypothetical protein